MSLSGQARSWNSSRFPRVSGDEPPTATDAELTPVFSPRERG